ncbi:MAG TPA: hypothetical protein VKP30_01365 [Polyangiaceae bacterium]|nr:hypothetical protein [Polyangiaceae bacterium]
MLTLGLSGSVHFLLIGVDVGRVQASTTQRLYYVLNGPTSPRLLSLTPWYDSLKLEWAFNTGGTSTHAFEYYCAPNEDPEGCHSSILERFGASPQSANEVSSLGGQSLDRAELSGFGCGAALGARTDGVVDASLELGQSYATALAARDAYGNLGALSNYLCATTQWTDDVAEPLSGRACTGCAIPQSRRNSWASTLLGIGLLALRRRYRG